MAAAEARAAWQRAANRCFVQEDAKRAPKLSPPPPPPPSSSSSSSSALHTDTDTSYRTNSQLHSRHDSDELHQLVPNLTPLNWNPYPMSTANIPADTRWWLQLHPNFAYQREFLLYEPKNNVLPPPDTTDPISPSPDFDELDPPKTTFSMSFRKHGGVIEKKVDDRKLRYDAKSCEDPLMPKKSEPWWRVADGEELASMVAQKALQHVENCDLPRPTQTLRYSCGDLHPDPAVKAGMAAFGDVDLDPAYDNDNPPLRKVFPPGLSGQPPLYRDDELDMEGSTRCRLERMSNIKKGSREELLEALCHSQTRAREAEMAAKKAHSEKEDIIKLLFRQASHLFAYKQWLKMLQLENLCLQLRIRDHQFPFPAILPFNSKPPSAPPPPHKKPNKIHKGNSICRYVIVFAVGLGLAGAGLLFGWTLGWLLPKL